MNFRKVNVHRSFVIHHSNKITVNSEAPMPTCKYGRRGTSLFTIVASYKTLRKQTIQLWFTLFVCPVVVVVGCCYLRAPRYAFLHSFNKALPKKLLFRGWNRFDQIYSVHKTGI